MTPRDPPVSGTLRLNYKGGYHGSLTRVPGKINSGPHWVFTKQALGPLNTSLARNYFSHVFKSKRNFSLMMTDTSVLGTFACLPSL